MAKFGIGASVLRKEDDRFLRGRGQYVADYRLAGMREVAFVRSPVAHARLRDIRIPAEFRDAVFTAGDLTGVNPIVSAPPLKGFKYSVEPILATGKLRFVGEMVAMCVADTRAEAEDIAAAITIDYDELPAVTDMLAAAAPGSPLVHEEWGDNIFVEFNEGGPIDEVAKAAAIKVSRNIRTARHCMFPMEGRGVVAYRDTRLRRLTLITSTQFPNSVQTGLCACLGLEHGQVRIISPDVGGGFGYKGLLCREEVALGWLAQQVDHPVRWLEDCREHLAANANCREHHYQITGYAGADGKLLAIECIGHVDAGAYSSYPISSSVEAAQIANLLPGPYIFSAYRCRSAAVASNKCPIIPYRGVARTGVCLAIEVIMDAIAREAKLEPYEVRLRNMVQPEQMPFNNIVGKHFDSGDHPECLRRAVHAIGFAQIRDRQKRPEPDGRLIGVGVSFFVEQGAHGTSVLASWGRPIVPGYEQANIKLTADGEVEIHVGTHSHGQGHETTYAQVAHEILGVEFDKIKVLQGDTLDASALIKVLTEKQVKAEGNFFGSIAPSLWAQGMEINGILYADYGIKMLSNVLACKRETVDKKPDLCKNFVEGLMEGLRYVYLNPEKSAAAHLEIVKEFKGGSVTNAKVIEFGQAVSTALGMAPAFKQNGLGYMEPTLVEQTATTVATYMGVKSLPKTDTMFTNKFVGSVELTDAEWKTTEERSQKYLPKRA